MKPATPGSGNDAGPKNLEVIRKNNIKTIKLAGILNFIRKLPAMAVTAKPPRRMKRRNGKNYKK